MLRICAEPDGSMQTGPLFKDLKKFTSQSGNCDPIEDRITQMVITQESYSLRVNSPVRFKFLYRIPNMVIYLP